MKVLVADVLKGYLEDLDYIDRIGGLVKSLVTKEPNGDSFILRSVPIEVNALTDYCNSNDFNAFVPDTQYKSVVFFEDLGSAPYREDGHHIYITTNLRIVCWFNLKKINVAYTDCDLLVMDMIETIPDRIANTSQLFGITTEFQGLTPNTVDLFADYDFDMAEHQYNHYPYDTAGLNYAVNYMIGKNCITITEAPAVC